MCARVGYYSDTAFINDITTTFGTFENYIAFHSSYNIAPSQNLPAFLNNGLYKNTHFGLIPNFAKEKKLTPVNARSETLFEKTMFKSLMKRKCCLIPANGFYEWQKAGKEKIPYWIYPKQEEYFTFAGVYDEWHNPHTGEIITSTAIITTEPNAIMRPIYNRMPVILEQKDWDLWLDSKVVNQDSLNPFFKPCDETLIDAHSVSTYVNTPTNNTDKCIEKVAKRIYDNLSMNSSVSIQTIDLIPSLIFYKNIKCHPSDVKT